MKYLENFVLFLIAFTLFLGLLGCLLAYFDVLVK